MSENPSIVFLGATGAVGGEALKHLLPGPARLSLLARRPMDLTARPGVAVHVVNTIDPKTYAPFLSGHDTAICTLGVGEPSKVPREEFKRIDHDAVLAFAKACRAAGVRHFVLLGSVGADPKSRSFYLQSKGELRDSIAALGFASFACFQPSMIITPTNRYGLSQAILLGVWPIVSLFLVGPLAKFKGIKVEVLGKAIAKAGLQPIPGNTIKHWPEITALAQD